MLRSMNSGVGLGGAYDATLERIKSQEGEKAKLALATLMWVVMGTTMIDPIMGVMIEHGRVIE